jgi:hypothetical protein
VRHFHPSDEAAAADWNQFAIDAVRKIESAASPVALDKILNSVFQPVAPTLRVYTGAEPKPHPALSRSGSVEGVLRWRNKGFGSAMSRGIYRSERTRASADTWKPDDVHTIDLGDGIKASVPLALFVDGKGTLPHSDAPRRNSSPLPAGIMSSKDRATRLAGVILAWNVFRHFYPYFDVVKTDWDAVLPASLKRAALDKDEVAFHTTLKKMVAELHDGHGRVNFGGAGVGRLPLTGEWIENKYIVTNSSGSAAEQVKPGDEIVAINGKTAAEVLNEAETLISSATPQWKRARSTAEALSGPLRLDAVLTLRPFGSQETKQVTLQYAAQQPVASDARPKTPLAELESGIWYFDLTRAQDKDFQDALPKLESAKGIVFDMRGYPRVTPAWFSHVTGSPLRSAQWHVPQVDRPGQMTFERGGEWNLEPKAPYLAARKVFLTNGGAISYAESTMGIVEHYKLGEIIGEATAGTNGNVNPIELPGGYTVMWTGMKVLKHDGTQHHGVGIRPTIPAAPTQAGVAAGRDELLERGIAVLKQSL